MVHRAWPIPVLPPVTKTDLIFTKAQIEMVHKYYSCCNKNIFLCSFITCDDKSMEMGIKEIASYLVAAPTFYFVTDEKS